MTTWSYRRSASRAIFLSAALAGFAKVGDLAFEASECRVEVLGQKGAQRVFRPAVDRHVGDEGLLLGREREVDGAVLVHALVDVAEELEAQPGAEVGVGIYGRAVLGPFRVQEFGGAVAEAVAGRTLLETSVEEADAGGEGCGEIVLGWVENAFAICTEAAEGHTEGEAQVVGGGLGVEFLDVGRERLAFGAVDGELGPLLGVAPRGGAGRLELDGRFAVGFVGGEVASQIAPAIVMRTSNWE